MELLDRYLHAVKKHLPWEKQDDIIAELRANLESQLEDREAELGRPLTQAEAEAWLKEMGPPIQVAGRYKPLQYLIGPAIFPAYWFVMRTVFFWSLAIYSLVTVILIFTAPAPSWTAVLEAALRLPFVLMTAAAWVTLTFAAFEFAIAHSLITWPLNGAADWSPGTLPAVERDTVPGKKARSYAQAVAEVIFGILLLIWLLLFPRYPVLLLGPGAVYLHISQFQLASVWVEFYWWIIALNVLQLGWHSWELWGERWQGPRTAQHIVFKSFGLIPMGVVLSTPDHLLVTLKDPLLDQARYGGVLDSINHWGYRGLLMVLAIAILQLLWDVGQLALETYRKRAATQ